MFYFIYHIPMEYIPWIIVTLVVLWAVIMRAKPEKYDKPAKLINIVMFTISVLGIVYITLMRKGTQNREIYLVPLHNFIEAVGETDFYRSMLMNLFLFVPFGVFATFSLPGKMKTGRKILITVVAAVVFSAIIEAMQYIFCLGRCETDDVLCNALGALIGSAAYVLYKIKDRK